MYLKDYLALLVDDAAEELIDVKSKEQLNLLLSETKSIILT